jgi:hypothetical protein
MFLQRKRPGGRFKLDAANRLKYKDETNRANLEIELPRIKLLGIWAIVTTVTPAEAGVQDKHN